MLVDSCGQLFDFNNENSILMIFKWNLIMKTENCITRTTTKSLLFYYLISHFDFDIIFFPRSFPSSIFQISNCFNHLTEHDGFIFAMHRFEIWTVVLLFDFRNYILHVNGKRKTIEALYESKDRAAELNAKWVVFFLYVSVALSIK